MRVVALEKTHLEQSREIAFFYENHVTITRFNSFLTFYAEIIKT
jgi:hypothetical protein